MFLVYFLIFHILVSNVGHYAAAQTINISLLYTVDYGDRVIQLAHEKLVSDGTIPSTMVFKVFPDMACATFDTIDHMVQSYHSNSINVILGPPCSTQMDPIGQLAASWNIPIIGYLSNDEAFADKTIYDTLARTSLLSSNYLGQAISMFLGYYNWQHVALITSSDSSTQVYRNGIVQAFATFGTTVNLELMVNQTLTAQEYTKQGVYQQLKDNARIIVFIMGADISWAMELLKGAQQANMTGIDSEYVWFTAWVDNTDTYTTLPWQNNDLSVNTTILDLYQGVLAMHVRGLEPQVLQNFSDWFSNASGGLSSNPRHLMPLYDAVCLFGIALQSAIQEYGSSMANVINNGTKIWSYMRDKDFQCSSVPVLTNNVADRLSSYSVYRIRADRDLNDSGILELVMYLDAVKSPMCNDSIDIIWANCFDLRLSEYASVTAIPDVPVCGFRGEKCDHTLLYIALGVAGFALAFVIFASVAYRQYRQKKVFLTPWLIPRDTILTLDIITASNSSILSLLTSNTSLPSGNRANLDPTRHAVVGSHHVVISKYPQNSHIAFNPRQLAQLYHVVTLKRC